MKDRYAKLAGILLVLVATGLTVLLLMPSPAKTAAAPSPQATGPSQLNPSPTELEDPNGSKPRALFIGDSYTAGVGATSENLRWTNLVSDAMKWQQDNAGLGGTGFVSVSDRNGCGREFCENYQQVARSVRDDKPDVIVVAGGQNDFDDWIRDPAIVEKAIKATYDDLRRYHPKAMIIAIGPSNVDQVGPAARGMDAAVQASSRRVKAKYVSLLSPRVITTAMVQPDGGHVNDAGHKAIAKRVLQGLEG